jgi:hypothetical protein
MHTRTYTLCFKSFSIVFCVGMTWAVVMWSFKFYLLLQLLRRYLKDSIAVIILNFVCLVLYTVDVFLIVLFLSFKTFLKSSDCIRAKVELILLCLFAIDWLLLVIQVAVFEATGNQAVGYIVQPFRCLRLAMIVCKSRNVAHVLAVMLSITVKLGKLMFVMLVYILIFSSIGTHLLMPHYSASNGSRLLEQLTANVCLSAYSNVSTHTSESPLSPMDTYSSRYRELVHMCTHLYCQGSTCASNYSSHTVWWV